MSQSLKIWILQVLEADLYSCDTDAVVFRGHEKASMTSFSMPE